MAACIAIALLFSPPVFLQEHGWKLIVAFFLAFIVVASCAILIPHRILISLNASKDSLDAEAFERRNSAQRQWIANTSHELRTPLSIIQGQVEAFQDGVREVNPKSLNALHRDILGLSKLVEDLHWLARFDIGQLRHSSTPTDLVPTINESLESFQERFAEKNIKIDSSGLPEKCIVNGDLNRLKQVFFNLLENSARYTNEGGTIKVTITTDKDTATIHFDDSEPGASTETLAQMFDRFFRGEASRSRTFGGAGLGLSICKNIVEIHNGSIQAQHSPLGGVRIVIKIPLAENKND